MRPVIIMAIVIPVAAILGVFLVQLVVQEDHQDKDVWSEFLVPQENPKISTDEGQRDEDTWQLYQKTYLEQECRELYIGQSEELEDCFDRIGEEQRLNPPADVKP